VTFTPPRIAGILNITADSFSDGGRYLATDAAVAQAKKLLADGADIVDVGPAASNPDAEAVSAAEEIRRLDPVLTALRDAKAGISVDSFLVETQRYAISRGVDFLNDIHGFPDPAFYPELAAARCRLIVMHAVQGRGPATRIELDMAAVWSHMFRFFEQRLDALTRAGIARERLVLDPGMGFFLSSKPEPSLRVLARLGALRRAFGLPLLVSMSRKSFLRALTGRAPGASGAATLAAELYAAVAGVDYIRTHDVAALSDGLRVWAAVTGYAEGGATT